MSTPSDRARELARDLEQSEAWRKHKHLPPPPSLDDLEQIRKGTNLAGIHLLNAEIAGLQFEDRARARR
jgi:hypothetical protein